MRYFPLGILKVSGRSMFPTLKSGQYVFVSSLPYFFSKPKIGDIVVVAHEDIQLIKRIKKQKDRAFFVAGDNDRESTDSRTFGNVQRNQILAKVILR